MERNVGHIDYKRTENRTNVNYTGNQTGLRGQLDHFRWFCGMYDLDYTYVCQAL